MGVEEPREDECWEPEDGRLMGIRVRLNRDYN